MTSLSVPASGSTFIKLFYSIYVMCTVHSRMKKAYL